MARYWVLNLDNVLYMLCECYETCRADRVDPSWDVEFINNRCFETWFSLLTHALALSLRPSFMP